MTSRHKLNCVTLKTSEHYIAAYVSDDVYLSASMAIRSQTRQILSDQLRENILSVLWVNREIR